MGLAELAWQERALCAQVDPVAFFPDKGGSVKIPKAVCVACPVREECLAYALEGEEDFGVWGGKSERERRKLLGHRGHGFRNAVAREQIRLAQVEYRRELPPSKQLVHLRDLIGGAQCGANPMNDDPQLAERLDQITCRSCLKYV